MSEPLVTITLSRSAWERVVLALRVASFEYAKDADLQEKQKIKHPDDSSIDRKNSETAARLGNLICWYGNLRGIFHQGLDL